MTVDRVENNGGVPALRGGRDRMFPLEQLGMLIEMTGSDLRPVT